MSTHRVDVFRIAKIEEHPNADALGIIKILGFRCCVRLDQFKEGGLAVYVEPDMVVNVTRPEFAFMQTFPGRGVLGNSDLYRVKVKKLRGIISQGLVIPAPQGSSEGDNVMTLLGITRYDPPCEGTSGGEAERGPSGCYAPSYGLENWHRYGHLLVPGEPVLVTEKLHGANGRFCWRDGRLYCGSRTEWKREDGGTIWWKAAGSDSRIKNFCEAHPNVVVYGEVFGQVRGMTYGRQNGAVSFRIFDLLDGNEWVPWGDVHAHFPDALPFWVPIIFEGPYDPQSVASLAEGKTTHSADHVREGVVVQPVVERTAPEIGRVKLKIVGDGYLSS